MNVTNSEHIIIQKLTGKNSLEDSSAEGLKNIIHKYPYFGIAHFLLAKKSALNNSDDFKKNMQRSALYFPNSLWMHFTLLPHEYNYAVNVSSEAGNIHEAKINSVTTDEQEAAKNNGTNLLLEQDAEEEFINEAAMPGEKIASLLKEQRAAFEKPVEDEAAVSIENMPYYKVDYFASQGIKLDAEKTSDDNLTVKLHKFTDWLKQMKRMSPHPTDLGTDKAMENLVQNIAENSNETNEVITETMAEVLVKQDKLDKAIELYNKLSFLNPSKSVYFAGKIQELKSL